MIRHRPITRAFTLIELLVVISIIAVLIAMLLPSLAASRATAQGTQCMGNQRQIAIALRYYVNEQRDWWMVSTYPYCGHANHYAPTWAAIAAQYAGNMYNTEYTTNATAYPTYVKFTSFSETRKKQGILKCPTIPNTVTNTWGGVISTNYGYNSYANGMGMNDYYTSTEDVVNAYGATNGPIYKRYYGRIRTSQIFKESNTILLSEGKHQGSYEYGGGTVMQGPTGLDSLHPNGTCNVLYTDGHSVARKPADVTTAEFVRFPQ